MCWLIPKLNNIRAVVKAKMTGGRQEAYGWIMGSTLLTNPMLYYLTIHVIPSRPVDLSIQNLTTSYFPIQNFPKIFAKRSSVVILPVISPR